MTVTVGINNNAVQLSRNDPDVDVRAGDCLRQRLHSQTIGKGSFRAFNACRADGGGRVAKRRFTSGQWR